MPKTTKINRNNKSSPAPKSLVSKSITSKKSVNKRVKLALVAFVLFAVSFMGAYRFVTGGWFGAKAATLLNYNPYYSKCDPAARATLTLKEGSVDSASLTTGTCVKAIQRALNDCCGQGLVEDGIFGPKTKQSVVNFQNFFKDPNPDGVVDKDLWNGIDYIHSVVVGNSGKKWVEPTKTYQDAVAARTAASASSGGSTGSTSGTTSGTASSGGSTGSGSGTTSGTAPSGGSTGSGSASPTKCSAGYVYSPTSGCVLSTASSSPTKCSAGYVYSPTSGCVLSPASVPKPVETPKLTACDRTYNSTTNRIVLKAEPQNTYRASETNNGCYLASNNAMVACFTGYKLSSGSPASCIKVPSTSVSAPGQSRIVYLPYKPTAKVEKRCGEDLLTSYSAGSYVNSSGVSTISYPNRLTKGCYKDYFMANTLKRGDPTSELISCFVGREYMPYYKYDNETKKTLSYLCIKV